jgi:hypothetical protein
MANKYIRKSSTFLIIKEIKIKTTLKSHLSLSCLNGYHQENKPQQILARMSGKRNLYTVQGNVN